jgi:uncharacterized RDD family membrane protein YckC
MIQDNLLDDPEELNQPNAPLQFASFGDRAIASIFDNIFALGFGIFGIAIIVMVYGFVFEYIMGLNLLVLVSKSTGIFILLGGMFSIYSFYFIWGESRPSQAAFGKEMMGLEVVDMGYQRISLERATVRVLLRWISTIFYLIGYIPAFFTQKHQTFHDLVANTLVVKKRLKI